MKWRLEIYSPGEQQRTEYEEDTPSALRRAQALVEEDEASFVQLFPPEAPEPVDTALKNRIRKAHGKAPLPISRGASRGRRRQ